MVRNAFVVGWLGVILVLCGCDKALVGDDLCGNALVDPGELCDVGILSGAGACPAAADCSDGIGCTADGITGEGCLARCEHQPITEKKDDDGCCPDGATFQDDADCPPGCGDEDCGDNEDCASCPIDCGACCGNGELDEGELCDTAIPAGAGSCPTTDACKDALACTQDVVEGAGCTQRCAHLAITTPAEGDGCCPDGATAHEDGDCPPGCGDQTCADDEDCTSCQTDCGVCCGNGELDRGELCDTAIATGAGHCPASAECDDGFDCTVDALEGESCAQRCTHQAILDKVAGDGCCPPGAIHVEDPDCPIVCGDEQCEGDEGCDSCPDDCGVCPPVCPADPLVPDGGTARAGEACEAADARACAGHAQASVLICDAASCTWKSADACTAGFLCDSVDATCRAPIAACIGHVPGDAVCDGPVRHVCGADLVSSTRAECRTTQLCALGQGGQCAECTDGEHHCQDADLSACAADHLGWAFEETCASAALCNAEAGLCTAQVCVAGQHRCVGDALEVCNGSGSGFEAVSTCDPGRCDATGGHCDLCQPLATECADGDTRRECAADGQQWVSSDCPLASPFCVDGGTCVECENEGDCPATGSLCVLATCNAGLCGTRALDPGVGCGINMSCDAQAACVCNWPWDDCNDGLGDGCEANLLSSGDHCNTCGHSCRGGECRSGYCQPVLIAQSSAFSSSIAQEGDYLYVGEMNAWAVLRIPKAGGDPFVITPVASQVVGVALDYTSVYCTTFNEVVKAPKAGGSATVWTQEGGYDIALSGSDIFYTDKLNNAIRVRSKSDYGSPYSVVTGQGAFPSGVLSKVIVHGNYLYWSIDSNSSPYGGWVRRSDLWGANQTDLATGDRITSLAVDDTGAYWVDSGNGVYAYTFADGQAHTLDDSQPDYLYYTYQVAVDDTHVYYANFYQNEIWRVPKTGGITNVFAWVGLDTPWQIVVDDCCVYVQDNQGIHRVVK